MIFKNYFILGAGGLAQEIREYMKTTEHVFSTYFVVDHDLSDDKPPFLITTKEYHELIKSSFSASIIGSGIMNIKRKMLSQIKGPAFKVIHENATVINSDIGDGVVIAPGAVVSNNTVIGKHVLINYCASIGHDTMIGRMSIVSPNASIGGHCSIGEFVYIGSGANVIENIEIGNNSIIGMGAIVTKDVPSSSIAIGNDIYSYEQWEERKKKK